VEAALGRAEQEVREALAALDGEAAG
jgi:hypothetical protein